MPGIYNDEHLELSELLKRASNDKGGATLLIPDLQRPYVWSPMQVRLLVDSLIRGWPFGTFLTWKVRDSDPVRELARPFWQVVDRTDESDGNTNLPMQPPSSFQMVLDGQQRIQSLLLAVGGDAWGFKLFDREWTAALSNDKIKSGGPNHWSMGSLCVDLDALVKAYSTSSGATGLDYTAILQWVVTGGSAAQSALKKKDIYKEPLKKAQEDGEVRGFIRLSRFWQEALGADVDLRVAEKKAAKFLVDQGIEQERADKAKGAVSALLFAIGRVKAIRVTYLELAEFKGDDSEREEYNDAVVNIFTRLNTAGRTLTREDITFAWLKTGWVADKTNKQSPTQCFEALGEGLDQDKLSLNTEQLVAGITFVWCALRDGNLLTNSDLMQGDKIRPMASGLSDTWFSLTASLVRATQIVREHGYRFHEHYESLVSIYIIWTWQCVADRWAAEHKLKELAKDAYDKSTTELLHEYLDRWILCSQWAGQWAVASAETIAGYSKRLFESSKAVEKAATAQDALSLLREFFDTEVKSLESKAVTTIQTLSTPKRELVRIYYALLWIWHRLDANRWKMSQIQLRTSNRRKPYTSVDHSVAYALWKRKLEKVGHAADSPELAQAIVAVNDLGNCALLERDFNISKSDGPLEAFLGQVHEFATKKVNIEDWAAAMALPASMLDPDKATVEEIAAAISDRSKLIREDLSDFVRGKKARVDI
jgi:hypothetical protein